MYGPLVVMTRKQGTRGGWAVHVEASSLALGQTRISTDGARIKVEHERRARTYGSGEQFTVPVGEGVLEVVCFRAEEKPRPAPTGRVMKAIGAVRAGDSDDARRVLSDVLEESGAVAEAQYVRLELELQGQRDATSERFVEGVKQLRVLSSVVGPTFRYLVGRDIEGCAGVRWAFRCPATWDSMTPTMDPDARVCTSCRQLVVQVTSEAEAARLARDGVCAQVQREEELWVGEMAAPDEGPRWVGSVAVRPELPELEPPAPEPVPPKEEKKPWWRRLLGR